MGTMELSGKIIGQMKDHAGRAYPDECCGAIFGSDEGEKRTVLAIMEIENTSEEDRRRRFSISPRDYLRAEREADRLGLRLLGFYHSHPDHPARPSETDRKFAQAGFSYPILATSRNSVTAVTSWRLPDEGSWYEEEEIRITADPLPAITGGSMTLLW